MQSIFKKTYQELLKVGRGIKKLRFFKFAHVRVLIDSLPKKEKIALVTLLGILALDLTYISANYYLKHTEVVPAYGGSFSEGLIGEPRYVNPLLAQTRTDKDLTRLVYSGLYKYEDNKIVPDLAESSLQISEDQKQYTVRLKPDLKWHDGEKITADDVVFTFDILKNTEYESPFERLWRNVTVEKIDDLTVKFTNKDISAPLTSNMTLGILPKHIWESVSPADFRFSNYNIEPIGNGPFAIKEISKSVSGNIRSISLNSFDDYSPAKAYIDTINLKFYADYEQLISALHTKEVDAIGFIPFTQSIFVDKEKTNLTINEIPLNQYQGLFFYLKNSERVLGDRSVRQALSLALDRDSFISEVYSSMALKAFTPILPGQIGYDENIGTGRVFDIEAANTILDNTGWVRGESGMRSKGSTALKFTITTNDFVLNQKSAEVLKKQWAIIGVDVQINIIPTADLEKNAIRPRNYEALLFAESTGFDPDPFVFWHSSQSNDPGLNLSAYKNTTVDRLISEARNNFDEAARAHNYSRFQELFMLDIPSIILDQTVFVYQMQPKIRGVEIQSLANPEDRFYDVTKWYVETDRVW